MISFIRGSLLAVALCSCLSSSRAAVPGSVPALQAVLKAADAGKPDSAAAFSVSGKNSVFAWIPDEKGLTLRRFFQPKPMQAATLEPPFTNGGPVAVFHTWHAPESDCDHIHPMVRTKAGWRFGPEINERDTQGYRIAHHELNVRIIPSGKKAVIRDTFTLLRTGKSLPVAYIRISDDFKVSALKAGASPVAFRQAGGIVAVKAPPGKSVRLTMDYSGVVDHKLMSAVTKELAVLSAYYYPTLGRLPATADVTAVVPKGWTAVTQGELLSVKDTAQGTAYRYRNTMPVNYFTLNAAPYTVTKRVVGKHTFYAYLLKAKPGFADTLLDTIVEAMPYYEKRFGGYPYTRYSVVDGGAIMGFVALEGYSMATYGTITLTPNVLAHELSHTWWGGVVPNTYLRSWWNEAFARYSDETYSRMRNGITEDHPTDRPWWPSLDAVSAAPLSSARDADSVNAIAYEKGRVVLRLLEFQLGQPLFDRCLQEFVISNRSALDPDWPDFQKTVQKVTGQDWDWFFAQWVRRAGWPELRLQAVKAGKQADGKWEVTGQIVQNGTPYRLDVEVQINDGVLAVPLRTTSTPFKMICSEAPLKVVIDPAFHIPRAFSVNDVAEFDTDGQVTLRHSREEPGPSPFGGM